MQRLFLIASLLASTAAFTSFSLRADEIPVKNVLVLVEGSSDLRNRAIGDGRQLAALLGHFQTTTRVQGVDEYQPRQMENFDFVFYIGFHARNHVPQQFQNDVMATAKSVIWMNTGFKEFAQTENVKKKFGFTVTRLDTVSTFDVVKSQGRTYTKGEPNLNIVEIANRNQAVVLASAVSSRTRKELPYVVRSGNLLYVADSPFASADATDRYLLFADMLHDILHEDHEESHSALIRIEDVTPMENPDRLRDIADILSSRGIPFLISVVPFYVNPGEGVRVSLSDKPEIVDALKYMVQNGGTIVEHGITHQYKGITASDFEFWDESTNKPIKNETAEGISRKLETGIQEFMKNGLYPLAWETPHYTASLLMYRTVANYFSTAVEQRLAIEDFDYSQFFPYVINKDLFGQRIYPENLGYVPLDDDKEKSKGYVDAIIRGAKANLSVRDGFASCFFHAFVDLDLLRQLVDGIQGLGYTYIDLREHTNWVKTKDRIILSGSQEYTLRMDGQYFVEAYYERDGELANRLISDARIAGEVSRKITLEPGQFYRAEPADYREHQPTMVENILRKTEHLYRNVFSVEESWREARVAVLWNHYARGAAFNDQASFASVFRSVNIHVDTLFIGQELDLAPYNVVVVPYPFIDSLSQTDYDVVTRFVEQGGNLITDTKNDLATELGVSFNPNQLRLSRIRDKYFPEERINWRYPELVNRFDADNVDEVFCVGDATETPLVIGKRFGKGKVIFIGTRFDPYSREGYSCYPYLLEYVRRYFRVGPIIRRENLEVYFDPGFRHTMSIEQLVKQWVSQGIRIVHIAGWHEYPKYTYDYKRMISLAHANGILVYAWLEPPQVSQKFWLEHPEWREKNYKGEDIQPSWRYPVALTDDRCVDTMVQHFRDFLERYEWDGVNLAELYFEAGRGFKDPRLFTPMHPSAQKEVRRKFNIDLTRIFDPASEFYWKNNPAVRDAIVDYRVDRLTQVYEKILAQLATVAREHDGFQIIVTAMDSFSSPELRENIAVDMNKLLALQRAYNFLLQVEDPENLWSTDPLRYIAIGKRYADLLGDRSKLLLDLNIVSVRKPDAVTPFPTLIQTGTECFHLINAASLGAPRLTIYSESSINPQDMLFLPYALASDVTYQFTEDGYEVTSPSSFVLKLPGETKEIRVDDLPRTAVRDNLFIVPAGTHRISITADATSSFSAHQLQGKISSITANLLNVTYGMRTMAFDYESGTRTLVSLTAEPTSLLVDGGPYPLKPMKGNDCYTIFLPPGRHHVELVTGDTFSFGINVTSFWSTTAIAVFGSVAVLSLFAMYLVVLFVRRRTLKLPS